jgi:hypothetical protein
LQNKEKLVAAFQHITERLEQEEGNTGERRLSAEEATLSVFM